ncbi:MAG: CsbD family protein [Cyanobacterium sp.]
MSLKNKAKATAKNIEGKIQETYGDVIGSPKNQAEGQAKQVEARVKQTVEEAKDEAKKIID